MRKRLVFKLKICQALITLGSASSFELIFPQFRHLAGVGFTAAIGRAPVKLLANPEANLPDAAAAEEAHAARLRRRLKSWQAFL